MPRRNRNRKTRDRPQPKGLSRAGLPPNLRHFAPRKPRNDDEDREPPYPRAA